MSSMSTRIHLTSKPSGQNSFPNTLMQKMKLGSSWMEKANSFLIYPSVRKFSLSSAKREISSLFPKVILIGLTSLRTITSRPSEFFKLLKDGSPTTLTAERKKGISHDQAVSLRHR